MSSGVVRIKSSDPLIRDHQVNGSPVMPGALQIEMALTLLGQSVRSLKQVRFMEAVVCERECKIRFTADEGVISATTTDGSVRYFEASESSGPAGPALPRPSGIDTSSTDGLYQRWADLGINYGPTFRTIREVGFGVGACRSFVQAEPVGAVWITNPILLDAAFQTIGLAAGGEDRAVHAFAPFAVDECYVVEPFGNQAEAVIDVSVHTVQGRVVTADAVLHTLAGKPIAVLTGVRMIRLDETSPQAKSFEFPLSTPSWRERKLGGGKVCRSGERWVLIGRNSDADRSLQEALEASGAAVSTLKVTDIYPTAATDRGASVPSGERISALIPADTNRIVYSMAGPDVGTHHELGVSTRLLAAFLPAVARSHRGTSVILLSERGQPGPSTARPIPARSAAWGLARTAAIELPALSLVAVDIDTAEAASIIAGLTMEPSKGRLLELYITGHRLYERVLHPVTIRTQRPPVKRGGAYVITGGHGGIGMALGQRLVKEGAGAVVLASRSGKAPGVLPASMFSIRLDVTDKDQTHEALNRIAAKFGRIDGIVHAAGATSDGLLRSMTQESLSEVLAAKVTGTINVAEWLSKTTTPPDFVALFGSVSGTFGNLGQAGYAAANSYLDGFAHTNASPWVALDWGLWGEVGMGVETVETLKKRGVSSLTTDEGLNAFLHVISDPDQRQVVISKDHTPVMGSLTDAVQVSGTDVLQHSGDALPDVIALLRKNLGLDEIGAETEITDLGISSIASIELAEALERIWRTSLPPTVFIEYRTVGEVAASLAPFAPTKLDEKDISAGSDSQCPHLGETSNDTPIAHTSASSSEDKASEEDDPAVIVDAVWSLPGGAPVESLCNPSFRDSFWRMLAAGTRFFQERHRQSDSTRQDVAAFLDVLPVLVDLDGSLFGLSPREIAGMDQQQLILLRHAQELASNPSWDRRDTGVFVAATYQHRRDRDGLAHPGPLTSLGTMNAFLASRISYGLDLHGPSETIDSLCSSSLVALSRAVDALTLEHCTEAIVAGVNVGLTDWYFDSLTAMGALGTLHSTPFDASANGFIPGEGAVTLRVKKLSAARRDGDQVFAIIRGCAVSHGGRGSSLTVPRSVEQAAVIRKALGNAGVTCDDVTLVEAHGTATHLGDPIEVAALREVFDSPAGTPCSLGTVKANIGHLEPAAGLAGIVKVLLAMRHGEIPPLAGFGGLNSMIDLAESRLLIDTSPRPWTAQRRIAGISAFGLGGTNAHVILESTSLGAAEGEADFVRERVAATDSDWDLRFHHLLDGKPTVPAAVYVAHAFELANELRNMSFLLPAHERVAATVSASVVSFVTGDDTVCQAEFGSRTVVKPLPSRVVGREVDPTGLYSWLDHMGVRILQPMQVLNRIMTDGSVVEAELRGGANTLEALPIDACLQAFAALTVVDPELSAHGYIPSWIECAMRFASANRAVKVTVAERMDQRGGGGE